MPTTKNVERKIGQVEGFDVIIRLGSQDVRGDKVLPVQYSKSNAAKGTYTVSQWIAQRFKKDFPGYDVDVLLASGEKASGRTLLSTVRESYTEEDENNATPEA